MDVIERASVLLSCRVHKAEPHGAAITGRTWRITLADGRAVFMKSQPGAPAGFFAAEVAGLRWLAAAPAGPPVPAVLGSDQETLILPWINAGTPSPGGVERLGRELAALHAAGAPGFGADWPGWIGAAELDNRPWPGWPDFYAAGRLQPYLRLLRDAGDLDVAGAAVFDRLADRLPYLAGPAEPPARIHGDLWSGNVLWDRDGRAWVIDPAAHGGHRETDLAMLALFGAAGLDRLLAAYHETAPLADGWPDRVGLHQLHPLLVHAVLFGGGYLERAMTLARRYAG
ncbi:MAG TPA: fructosamine kinase family protein [Mycobacteriales bacterium]|nr:fructosamine kinase family protein [Mycobacteriales bacterium]